MYLKKYSECRQVKKRLESRRKAVDSLCSETLIFYKIELYPYLKKGKPLANYHLLDGYFEPPLTDQQWQQLALLLDIKHEGKPGLLFKQYDLSEDERRLCCISLLSKSGKDKCRLLGITGTTLRKRTYRLKKKLGIPGDKSLAGFILSLKPPLST